MSDLTEATRELFVRSLKNQVYMQTPVLEEMLKRNKITVSGGTDIRRLVDTAEVTDVAQLYTTTTPLTNEPSNTLAKPYFTWRKMQVPMEYDADIELQNAGAGSEEQLLDLVQHITKKAQRAARLKLEQMIFNTGSTTGVADGTTSAFQSLVSALDHDVTYGTLSRSLSANIRDWWQGADPTGLTSGITTSSQATAYSMTISNLRKWIYETDVAHHMESPTDLYIVMCPTLFNKIRAEAESKLIYKEVPSGNVKQSVKKFELDDHTIVSSPYLQTTSTMKTWVFILNLNDWELRLHSKRNFKVTPWEWQGKMANGYDFWLARIMVVGNLMCWKPNGSMWLSNVT